MYCTERVLVYEDVEPDMLDGALGGLVSREMVLCPTSLNTVFTQKCDTLTTKVHFYEGSLWLVENEMILRPARFAYLQGSASLCVIGSVEIAADVDPQILFERLAGVYNWGEISCRPEQMDAIEAKMVVNEGELADSTPKEEDNQEEDKEDGTYKINVGNFKL